MIKLKGILTKDSFSDLIESKVKIEGFNYFQAILDFADENDKDPEELIQYMSSVILDKVRKSATDAGLARVTEPDLESLMD